MFSCCESCQDSSPSGEGYLVKHKLHGQRFVSNFADIKESDLFDSNTSVIKLNKSQYEQISQEMSGSSRKFADKEFQPNDISIGEFKDIKHGKWKRISEIVKQPVLFNQQVLPSDVVQTNFGDKTFLASLAALAEN